MSSESLTLTKKYPDGKLELIESYIDGELHLVSVEDYRDRTTERLVNTRTASVTFIFKFKHDRIELSRIFGNTASGGGYAMDMGRTSRGYYVKNYENRSLLDEQVKDILKQQYPEHRLDIRRVRDRLKNLVLNHKIEF